MLMPHVAVAGTMDNVAALQKMEQDFKTLRILYLNLNRLEGMLQSEPALIDPDRKRDLDIDELEGLVSIWASYLDYLLALETLNSEYRDFLLIKDKLLHRKAFLLAGASYVAKVSHSLRFINRTMDNELYEKKLDEPRPSYGIPGGMYAWLKWNTIHLSELTNMAAAHSYNKHISAQMKKDTPEEAETLSWVFELIKREHEYFSSEMKGSGMKLFANNGLDILKDNAFKAWFPAQRRFALTVADIYTRKPEKHLITSLQRKQLGAKLSPGDIMVSRKNWHLTNAGIPGFWKHAAIYVGKMDKIEQYFDSDKEVKAHYSSLGDFEGFTDYLKNTFPDKVAKYNARSAEVVEAIAEGVIPTTFVFATQADYLGALSPRVSKLRRALAIEQTFRYMFRPYDFNFDFLTDSSLVCSELVYKVYLTKGGIKGLEFELRELAGRKLVSPNDIVIKFDKQAGTPEEELEFLFFIDSFEGRNRSFISSMDEFRATHARPSWDIVLEMNPKLN